MTRNRHSLKGVISKVAQIGMKFSKIFSHRKHYLGNKLQQTSRSFNSVLGSGCGYNSQESNSADAKVFESPSFSSKITIRPI